MWGSPKLLCAVWYHFPHVPFKYLQLTTERLASFAVYCRMPDSRDLKMGHGGVCSRYLYSAPFSHCSDFWGGPVCRHLAKGRRCSCVSQSVFLGPQDFPVCNLIDVAGGA